MNVSDLKVKIFADGADIDGMMDMYERGIVSGFTTNPTLMKKAGVESYTDFARDVTNKIKDMPISFEVFADDFEKMEKEARILANYGDNVYVKIPVTNTKGEDSTPLIKRLAEDNIQLNITVVFTIAQVKKILSVLPHESKCIISVFAGRIADAGVDPELIMKEAKELCVDYPNVELLWASCREVFNIIQADRCNTDIITVTNDILGKLPNIGKDLSQFSVETVQMFVRDGQSLGFRIDE